MLNLVNIRSIVPIRAAHPDESLDIPFLEAAQAIDHNSIFLDIHQENHLEEPALAVYHPWIPTRLITVGRYRMQGWNGGKKRGCAGRLGMLLRAQKDKLQIGRDFLPVEHWYELDENNIMKIPQIKIDRTIAKYMRILEQLTILGKIESSSMNRLSASKNSNRV